MNCECKNPHYPLKYFKRSGSVLATRGNRPVQKVIEEGWEEFDPRPEMKDILTRLYNINHPFDWLHTPTYQDDKELHLKMKEETKR